jgi:hypothetical protein
MIPALGAFHYSWHVQQAIFKVAGMWFLCPLARFLNRSATLFPFDGNADNFHMIDMFLLNLAEASVNWINKLMASMKTDSIADLLESVQGNSNLFQVLSIFTNCVIPYSRMREAVRAGDGHTFHDLMLLWIPLFISTNKTRYAKMSLTFRQMVHQMPEEWREMVFKTMFVRLSSGAFCVGLDALVEQVNLSIEVMFPGKLINSVEDVKRRLMYLNARIKPCQAFEEHFKLTNTRRNLYKSESPTNLRDIKFIEEFFEDHFGNSVTPELTAASPFSHTFDDIRGADLPQSFTSFMSLYYGTSTHRNLSENGITIKLLRKNFKIHHRALIQTKTTLQPPSGASSQDQDDLDDTETDHNLSHGFVVSTPLPDEFTNQTSDAPVDPVQESENLQGSLFNVDTVKSDFADFIE